MNEDRIKELFSNEDFVKDLFESKSYEEAQAKLAANDVELSIDELKKALKLLKKEKIGELSDDELEEVSGGMDPVTIVGIVLLSEFVIGGIATTASRC